MKYTLEFHETETGSCPVADFLISLPAKARRKATTYFEVLEEGGPNLREPYTKHLRDGLYELRCQCGQDTMRFIFFYFENRIIVATNGFRKKTCKTPGRELRLADERRKDYVRRYSNEA